MKAVILAGGLGTRLRPLTLKMPKALIPLCGKPLILHLIDSFPSSVDTVVLAVSYMKEELEQHFQRHDCGRKVILVEEKAPLGTGGAIKNVASYLDGPFIACNGDLVTALDFSALLDHHRHCGGMGTIALRQVNDPTAFGVVGLDAEGRIEVFQEKPLREEAVSDLINAGAYVFQPEVLDHIGEGVVSLERQVFPRIIQHGLYGHKFQGYWVDCGTREGYLLAQRELLDAGIGMDDGVERTGTAHTIGRNYLKQAQLVDCTVGPYVSMEPGVKVEKGATISNSIILAGAHIGKRAHVRDAVIGPGVVVEDKTTVAAKILV